MERRHPFAQRHTQNIHAIDYVEAIINADVSRVDGIKKNPVRVRALLRSLSRNISTLATIRTIHDDIAMGDADESISEKTISQYLAFLDFQANYIIAAEKGQPRSSTEPQTKKLRSTGGPQLYHYIL